MTIQELIKSINFSKKAGENALRYCMPEKEFRNWKNLYERDFHTFLAEWEKSAEHFQWGLWFCLKLACETYEWYKEKTISEQIFRDTFADITIWCGECYRKYGIYGLEEVPWIMKSIRMELFRLGRLQFEPMVLTPEEATRYHLQVGEPVLNVHIPAGEKLGYRACKESFEAAKSFFGEKQATFICDSWLLSPELCEILPKTSNIIRFQKMYQIVEVHYDFSQAEERVFGEVRSDKSEYPEENSLQLTLKQYLLTGKKVGMGRGILLSS